MEKKKIRLISAGIAAAVIISGASFLYAADFGTQDIADSSSYTQTETSESCSEESFQPDSLSYSELYLIEDYELNISDFYESAQVVPSNATSKSKSEELYEVVMNNYGCFSLLEGDNGKIKTYSYGSYDKSKKYLVKGQAEFDKYDINFEGYFLVDNTLSGKKKGQITMYKGTISLPNGDKFEGELSEGKYYSNGTYSWKNGQSYKGCYTKTNKLGSSSLGDNIASAYGTFYFDKNKKESLYIRFVNSVPREAGYYYKNGVKYTVKFDSKGTCIYTKKS